MLVGRLLGIGGAGAEGGTGGSAMVGAVVTGEFFAGGTGRGDGSDKGS